MRLKSSWRSLAQRMDGYEKVEMGRCRQDEDW